MGANNSTPQQALNETEETFDFAPVLEDSSSESDRRFPSFERDSNLREEPLNEGTPIASQNGPLEEETSEEETSEEDTSDEEEEETEEEEEEETEEEEDEETFKERPEEKSARLLRKIQMTLSEKCKSEMSAVEARVAENPLAWSDHDLNEAADKIQEWKDMLELSQKLRLKKEETTSSSSSSIALEIGECPVCYVLMNSPGQIYSCSKGHSVCSFCLKMLRERRFFCPICRENFNKRPPRRNLLAEDLIREKETLTLS